MPESEKPHMLEHVWNVMAHAQKPDLVVQRNGRVQLNWRGWGGGSVQSTTGSRGVRISGSNGSNAGYTTRIFPLHFPYRVSPCPIRFQLSSTSVYLQCFRFLRWLLIRWWSLGYLRRVVDLSSDHSEGDNAAFFSVNESVSVEAEVDEEEGTCR